MSADDIRNATESDPELEVTGTGRTGAEDSSPPLTDQMAVRMDKRRRLADAGETPYGGRFPRTHSVPEVLMDFDSLEGTKVRAAGRIRTIRRQGAVAFIDLQDAGARIQLFCRANTLGERYSLLQWLDIGDIVGVEGTVMRTRRGEQSIEVTSWELLSKALRPLPEKWHGLRDVELRYRQRYVDLIVNPDVRDVFITRSKAIAAMRQFLVDRGFLEVETPMLNPIPGGANARPFVTHHNALDMDLYMRIAPELYLKRLLVGGFDKVFEIGKNFRNEGISTRHNPEFTAIEVYEAYADAVDMMRLTEELFAYVAEQVAGSPRIVYQGTTVDLTPPWERLSMLEAVRRYAGLDLDGVSDDAARRLAAGKGVAVDEDATAGAVLAEVFERLVENHLIQPVFITDHPVEVSPLAKRKSDAPAFTERFEPFIVGWEVANGFSELNDPVDQRLRFEQQAAQRERGDAEAHMMDEDFLRALEYGMPPAAGLGIGVDRFVMLLTDSASIRDVLLFPHMRERTLS